jgi:Winged helix-turn helix
LEKTTSARRPGSARPRLIEWNGAGACVIVSQARQERGEPSSWTLPDLCRFIEERFGKTMCPQSMSRVVRRRAVEAKGAPRPSQARCPRGRSFRKKGLRDAVTAAAEAHPDKRLALWFMDEARVGQKGRTGHRWWIRGERPPGLGDRRFASAYIFAAVRHDRYRNQGGSDDH